MRLGTTYGLGLAAVQSSELLEIIGGFLLKEDGDAILTEAGDHIYWTA